MSARRYLWLGGALLLSACSVGKDYHLPSLDLPSAWHSPAPVAKENPLPADVQWWKSFNDETLNGLIDKALANNQDLKIAQGRILEARASRESTTSSLFPTIALDGQASRASEGLQTFGKPMNLYQAQFDASYELDLFGGNRRQVEAQNAAVEASEADLRDITITLTAEVAREYVGWRQLQQQVQLTRDTMAAQKKLYDIVNDQLKAGAVSRFDLSQADTLYKATAARAPDLDRQLQATGYRLSVLLGESSGPLNERLKDMKPLPQPVAIAAMDAPASVIARRPDVQRAERQLAAATALHGAAIGEAYPKISLSALFGIQNASLAIPGLGAIGTNAIWSAGAGVAQPLIDFGKIEGQIKAADAREQQSFHTYQKTVLAALADVETSLTDLDKENQRRLALQASSDSAAQTLSLAHIRYKEGISDFTDVLQTEQQFFNAQSDLVNSQATTLTDLVALYKSLGIGGGMPAQSGTNVSATPLLQ